MYEVQPGVTQTAAMMRIPIVAFHSAFDRVHEFPRSWDKHVFPRFFAKQTIVYSEPLFISKDEDAQKARLRVESRMRGLVEQAEGAYGRTISF